jgi:3-oxoacyl-[acyl-carrier-protein] synthase II
MRTKLAIDIGAPAELVFDLARDIERWPALLPHYLAARVRERHADRAVTVEFVAMRAIVPVLGLGVPVAWRSRAWAERDGLRLRFVHQGGATDGMDVTWRIAPSGAACHVTIEHDFRPRVPGWAFTVDRLFVRPIAIRTLRTFRSIAEAVTDALDARTIRERRAGEQTGMRREVWITGLGVVSPIGTGRDAFWNGVRADTSPVRRIDRFDPAPFRSQVAAQVDDFDPLDHMDPRTARQLDRFSQFGLAAGRLALADAGLSPDGTDGIDRGRFGIYLGSALGGIAYAERQHERFMERGIRSVAPNLALAVFGGAAPANIGIALDLRGPILSTANSCASGAVALGEALRAIRDGVVDAAIAGGVEIPLSPLAFGAFDIIRALSGGSNAVPERAARPFDAGRDGFVMGEAAGLLVLEAREVAERRGAVPYAELMGYGSTSDAHHMVQPRADGREAARAISIALADAGASGSEVEYVNAHASSTPLGDSAEARALALALDGRASTVPVSGTKALYGHPLGASSALEASICALAIRDGWAPGTTNLETVDPDVSGFLPGLLREGRVGSYGRVLSTSFGFGGLNAALVFGAVDGA